MSTSVPAGHYEFAPPDDLGPVVGRVLRVLGLYSKRNGVWLDDQVLDVTFGPWRVRTPLDNIASAEVGGPYSAWKVIGARLSLADRGLTFGTTTRAGVCIRFHRPVPGIEPTGMLRHPGLTVTVTQPELLAERLHQILARRS